MLASRGSALGQSAKSGYICLSCKLKTQKRRYGNARSEHHIAGNDAVAQNEYNEDAGHTSRSVIEKSESYPLRQHRRHGRFTRPKNSHGYLPSRRRTIVIKNRYQAANGYHDSLMPFKMSKHPRIGSIRRYERPGTGETHIHPQSLNEERPKYAAAGYSYRYHEVEDRTVPQLRKYISKHIEREHHQDQVGAVLESVDILPKPVEMLPINEERPNYAAAGYNYRYLQVEDRTFPRLQTSINKHIERKHHQDQVGAVLGSVDILPNPIEMLPKPVEMLPKPVEMLPKPVEMLPKPVELLPKPVEILPKPVGTPPKPVEILPEAMQTTSKYTLLPLVDPIMAQPIDAASEMDLETESALGALESAAQAADSQSPDNRDPDAQSAHLRQPPEANSQSFISRWKSQLERYGPQEGGRKRAPKKPDQVVLEHAVSSTTHEGNRKNVETFTWQRSAAPTLVPPQLLKGRISARLYHSSGRTLQQVATAGNAKIEMPIFYHQDASATEARSIVHDLPENRHGIRAQLRKWQELHGHEDPMPEVVVQEDVVAEGAPTNNLTRLPDEASIQRQARQEEKEAFEGFAEFSKEGFDGTGKSDVRFLAMGDLVEIEFMNSERESLLGVYVRPISSGTGGSWAQFFTMQGRWMHIPEKQVQYSIPGWISPAMVEPLLKHLPSIEEASDSQSLMSKAYVEDLSVPRDVAAPLVKRMVDFYSQSQDIYRKHASTLDDAHNILAHGTDLRYGSLVSAATTLLRIPADKLPLTALFTVRKALVHGGFAFNIDRRSHRLTGYMQIRSKEQVRMVEDVRNWLRQWQEDLARSAALSEDQKSRHKVLKGAQHVYSFLGKAKAIITKSREDRQPTHCGNVGPSKVRLPISETSDCVKSTVEEQFTDHEQEIVRFLESWACSTMFDGLSRVESLPPLILQATGLYDEYDMTKATGFMFLQELGTIMPYENRIRFDQHLLLPSSQHSRPLQNLMTSLLAMKDNHNFVDSMAHLRHDWGQMPVYCIDDASAHEIDDGVSVESAGIGSDGKEHYWVHIHIANPTAFFSRDHPLAKMARHMGETIYMPERTYMMLPRWATQRHFSLAPNRPCLTFSAKLDDEGNTLERKITSGTIRNVLRYTGDDVEQLLGCGESSTQPDTVLTVGGDPPPDKPRESPVPDATPKNVQDLGILQKLAGKRADARKRAGGVFFDSHKPRVKVWQSWKNTGLAWDHPYRKGSRTTVGDPIIQMKTRGLRNWFAPSADIVDVLVRECMLLACETAAAWSAERQIPVIYRGTVPIPSRPDPRPYWENTMVPAMREDGSFPMHLGMDYIQLLGSTVLRTEPKSHAFLGMQYYSKVTSPLRRYGDMILHWQIEAALRYEAETGRSLTVPPDHVKGLNRSFLPFSKPVLDTIMLGLQPRESIITRAKQYAEEFWISMLLFRKLIFNEDGGLPFKTMRLYIHIEPPLNKSFPTQGLLMETATGASMMVEKGQPEIQKGDVWEVVPERVDVYVRQFDVKPLRLIGRNGAGLL